MKMQLGVLKEAAMMEGGRRWLSGTLWQRRHVYGQKRCSNGHIVVVQKRNLRSPLLIEKPVNR